MMNLKLLCIKFQHVNSFNYIFEIFLKLNMYFEMFLLNESRKIPYQERKEKFSKGNLVWFKYCEENVHDFLQFYVFPKIEKYLYIKKKGYFIDNDETFKDFRLKV